MTAASPAECDIPEDELTPCRGDPDGPVAPVPGGEDGRRWGRSAAHFETRYLPRPAWRNPLRRAALRAAFRRSGTSPSSSVPGRTCVRETTVAGGRKRGYASEIAKSPMAGARAADSLGAWRFGRPVCAARGGPEWTGAAPAQAAVGCSPSSSSAPACSARAAITKSTCSSKSIPRSWAPRRRSSRSTAAANDGCLSFLRTDLAASP